MQKLTKIINLINDISLLYNKYKSEILKKYINKQN